SSTRRWMTILLVNILKETLKAKRSSIMRLILKVVVDEVIKRYDVTTPRVRLLQERIRAPLDSCMILSSAHRLDQLIVQELGCLL
nr:hypothetical protein [Tanacetum cinerariifolium]